MSVHVVGFVRRHTPAWARRSVRRFARKRPAPGSVDFGSLRRLSPLSRVWGYDRGSPVDRYYIERFLVDRQRDISGRVLEIGDRGYTLRFGAGRVEESDVLHVAEGTPEASIIADLNQSAVPALPSAAFDCVIFTQTLQFLYELRPAVANLHRALKANGVLLATMPGISAAPPGDRWVSSWCWSFTVNSIERLFGEVFGDENVEVHAHGNVFAAAASLYGVAAEELDQVDLDHFDPAYPVVITVRAVTC